MPTSALAYCRIFPPVGIARLGNSPEEIFIGPEAPGVLPDNQGSYKDGAGRIKRQGARFRIYAFDDHGQVIELTADHPDVASIAWKVTLANKKAEWYAFGGSRRVAEILAGGAEFPRRNRALKGAERRRLIIGPASASIDGRNQISPPLIGDFGAYLDAPRRVLLGELRTDEAGRLLVIGGRGTSDSVLTDNPLASYANNDGWYDDTSDGPVTAVVKLKGGKELEVQGRSWVIVAPPHYSPGTLNVVTLWDAMAEAALLHELEWSEAELGPRPVTDPVSFSHDVYPVLQRLSLYQWTSDKAHRGHARGKAGDFFEPETLARLADPAAAREPLSLQKRIFQRLRAPLVRSPYEGRYPPDSAPLDPGSQDAIDQANLAFMPPLSGDEGDATYDEPESWFSLTWLQYQKLQKWSEGNFQDDWGGSPPRHRTFAEIPIAEQPASLARAALEACQGGAFYPGIEITSICRFASFYREALRLASEHEAGDVTRWMALPWQADFYECRSNWWPAVRPDDIVPADEYERIVEEFTDEAKNGDLATLLVVRKPWARGVGLELPGRPGLPSPEAGDSPRDYERHVTARIRRFGDSYLSFIAGTMPPLPGELGEGYRRRLTDFLERTILDAPGYQLPVAKEGEPLSDYLDRALADLGRFLGRATALPVPVPGESLAAYAQRVSGVADGSSVWQGLFNLEWRRRAENRGKNDLVVQWSRLGFVAPRTHHGEIVFIETERGRYDLLPFRDAFYYLMNIEGYPAFLPKARELADEYLRKAGELLPGLVSEPALEHYNFFTYDEITFRARMEKIYETERRAGEAYDPVTDESEPLFRTPAHVVERIRQLAPFNQLDGAWLEKATKSGPIDDIRSFLFEIWSDEIGNGDPAQNHANIYTNLMQSAGLYLPPVNSRAYADHPDLWEASFSSPAYQAAIAHFPETYFPELLGMTLYLEWEAIFLPAMVKLYEYHGYDTLFYRLHVAIDNPVNGHGARARDAVVRYLDHVRSESGEEKMQSEWRRIWNGYLAFRFVGSDEWTYRFTHPPTLDERMVEMFEQKRHYAQLNHGRKQFGPNSINDWFDQPFEFLLRLTDSELITRGEAKGSRFFDLIGPTGPMLKVFNNKERELWAEWINSLPRQSPGGALEPGEAMRVLVEQFRSRGTGAAQHRSYLLTGEFSDPGQGGQLVRVTKPVAWWFGIGQPLSVMAALRDISNGWVTPGDTAQSRLVTELLGGGEMGRALLHPVPELGGKPARQVIIDWIAAGCPIPAPPALLMVREAARAVPSLAAMPEREDYAREILVRSLASVQLSQDQRLGLRRRRYGPGGGAAH